MEIPLVSLPTRRRSRIKYHHGGDRPLQRQGLNLALLSTLCVVSLLRAGNWSDAFGFARCRSFPRLADGASKNKLTVAVLKTKLKELKLPVSGKKQDLVQRVRTAMPEVVPPEFEPSLSELTVVKLQEQLREKQWPVSGRKADLVSRLVEAKISEALQVDAEDDEQEEVDAGDQRAEEGESVADARRQLMEWWQARDSPDFVNDTMKAFAAKRILQHCNSQDEESVKADKMLEDYFADFPEMRDQLNEYQHAGVKFAARKGGRCLLGDEMGLGKTLQALVASQLYADEWPVLVITPASVLSNWRTEVERWLPHLTNEIEVLMKLPPRKDRLRRTSSSKLIRVIGYEKLCRNPDLQSQPDGQPYKVVVVDEAHQIKSPGAVRTNVVHKLCKKANRCFLLTGTPILNGASEVWSLLAAIDADTPSHVEFCERYSNQESKRDEVVQTGVRNSEELHLLLDTIMIRRRKKDTMALPEKSRIIKMIPLESIDGKHKQSIFRLGRHTTDKNYATRVFSITAKAKASVVTDYVMSVAEKGEKMVVFAHHNTMLSSIERRLKAQDVRYVRIDGSVPTSMRPARINKFQEEEGVQVALLSLTAMGQGIQLTAARQVVFAELFWVPARLLQAEDRVHRRGQEQDVKIHYCAIEGSHPFMDMNILNMLFKKEKVADQILDRSGETMDFASSKAEYLRPPSHLS